MLHELHFMARPLYPSPRPTTFIHSDENKLEREQSFPLIPSLQNDNPL